MAWHVMSAQQLGRSWFVRNGACALQVVFTAWLTLQHAAFGAETANDILASVERTIGREPKYDRTPRYALCVLGPTAAAKVWMVEDGDVLYVDQNGNGDLTDDGPPISQTESREWKSPEGTNTDCDYTLSKITTPDGREHTDFHLRRWKYGKAETKYGLSLSLDGKIPMYAGWFGTIWASRPADVPVMHFGGALKPTKLSGQQFVLGSPEGQLDTAFVNDGLGSGARTYLSIDAMTKDVIPVVEINWPVAPGAEPVKTVEVLTQRCCYWNYYKTGFQLPENIVEGDAILTFVLPAGAIPLNLATNTIKVPVRAKAK